MVWRNKDWKKTDLMKHGHINEQTMILFCLDMYARVKALENGESDGVSDSEPTTRDLSFTINDGTDAVEGATVKIGDVTGTTGSSGGCTLKNIPEGIQSVVVTATGFAKKTESITVDESHISFTISLTAN